MATVEIERASGDEERDSTTFRLLPPAHAARVRSVEPGQDLGTALRNARRRRRISLEQAARETRIGVRYLTALERGAPLDEFPAPMFARAFLREYARFLRLDPEPLLQLLAPYEPPAVAPTLAVLTRSAPRPVPHKRLLALAAAAGLSVLLVLGSDDPLRTPQTTTAATLDEPAPATEDTDVSRIGSPSSELTADLRVTGRTWLRVTVDDTVAFEGIAMKGWSRSFTGSERLRILIGNAGAVELVVNGEPMGPLGATGAVRELLITPGPDGPDVRSVPRKS